ncbi:MULTISPECIES: hypothetical protein [Bacillales]|uniref:hypothetical protein n=1 Tax=Bacillales TaxID=1385 RepID=UPI00190C0176|nr:hypothetical protein [Staphylococcus aureus]MBK3312565.1 hypothetical protein [Staphylococcus aureus]WAI29959.1 MAG: hypothetical protein NRZ50_30475 [Bacillus paranthracis]WAI35726.1 MAG: hypothetical protein NRZ52_30570 [Bacillus paranthracis]WAI41603.1 MAG: hypothetical protein NRZ51_30405 [Bacillus paranthracis]
MKKPIYKHWLFWVVTALVVTVGINIIVLTSKTKSVAATNTSNIPKNLEKFVDIYNNEVKEKDAAIYMIPRDFKIEKANYKDGSQNVVTLIDTIGGDLKKKTESQNVDSFNKDAESLTIVLDDSKESIKKIIYRGNRINAFIFTLTALELNKETEANEMFTKLNDKVGEKKFDITSFIKDYKVKFEYDLSAMPILPTITFTFEKY